jgi:hypothetical protein
MLQLKMICGIYVLCVINGLTKQLRVFNIKKIGGDKMDIVTLIHQAKSKIEEIVNHQDFSLHDKKRVMFIYYYLMDLMVRYDENDDDI